MLFDNKAWLTLNDKNFNTEDYVYHFTSVEKASLILDGDCLRFAKISVMNDTLEAKPKIDSDFCPPNIENINKNYMQLLCFSRDVKDTEYSDDFYDSKVYASDYTGRGFSLPRMWAQYAHDNDGVCFIFNKNLLIKEVNDQLRNNILMYENVNYISKYEKLPLNYENIDLSLFKERINNSKIISFFRSNKEFTKYNYFYKLKDWENEREFRILAFGKNNFYLKNIKTALVGIVVGEKIKPTDEKIVKLFCNDMFEIKKINFLHTGCSLETIYE